MTLSQPIQKERTSSPESTVIERESLTAVYASGFWTIFGSTFLTIFLAEIGDKTQLATLLMSAESHAPWVVFAGAASALVTTSLLGVLVGQWLATRLSPRTLEIAMAVLLLVISALLLGDVVQD